MSLKYGKFEMPQKIIIEETDKKNHSRFVAEPFERGFGHTLGNSIRRMLLTSLEAPAIIGVRIEGVPHEYMAVEGIIEDMTNIVLNLKGALLRRLPNEESENSRLPQLMTKLLEVSQEDLDSNQGQYDVKLSEVIDEKSFEIVNPDLQLFTVTKPLKKQLDLRIAFGRGFVPSERHEVNDLNSGEILIDASFSPVRLVNYYVENTRVGQDTDFDRLVLEVTTDGRVSPKEAIGFTAQILLRHIETFVKVQDHQLTFEEVSEEDDADRDEIMEKLSLRIDEIELSVRSTNCLSGASIETIGELVSIPERRMLEFRNFGKKSLNEIKAKLQEMGLSLGMDLSRYKITMDNVKDKIREYQEKHPKEEVPTFEE